MVQASFAGVGSAAGVITVYPVDATHAGSQDDFIDGIKVFGTATALTQIATGLKAIEYLLDATYSDITGD